jgi:DICT domain-containing protein
LDELGIQEVAERTGVAAATLRVWERRYGFPRPGRTSSGRRRYHADDIEAVRRVLAYRDDGLSVGAAISQTLRSINATAAPSLVSAVLADSRDAPAQVLRKSTLSALSRAIEHEALIRADRPVVIASFQREGFYRVVERRYRRLARQAEIALVLADFPAVRHPAGGPSEIPIDLDEPLGNQWAVIIDAPGYAACLVGWEQPAATTPPDEQRRFEALWTLDPEVTRHAARATVPIAARHDPSLAARLAAVLDHRPLAFQTPAPALTALANRALAYVEASRPPSTSSRSRRSAARD